MTPARDGRDGRLRQEVVHAVFPEPHARDYLGIHRRSIFSRSETAVLRVEIARGVFERRGHFLGRFARHAARNEEQLLRRLLRERQQQLLSRRAHLRGREIAADAHHGERLCCVFIVAKDQALANRVAGVSIRKEFFGKAFGNDGDEVCARSIIRRETAAAQKRDAHRGQIVVVHTGDVSPDDLRRPTFRVGLKRGTDWCRRGKPAADCPRGLRRRFRLRWRGIVTDAADSRVRVWNFGAVDLQRHGCAAANPGRRWRWRGRDRARCRSSRSTEPRARPATPRSRAERDRHAAPRRLHRLSRQRGSPGD